MNLSKEMKDLFLCLLREDDWITSEELSEKLRWSRKKVQQNMRLLTEELDGLCSIETQKNKGYLLIDLSEEFKAYILQDVYYHGTYFNLNERRAILALDLVFRDSYVSMDKLAEEYYLSKTAIFDEIRHMKRWFKRMEYLNLDVSPQKGIRIFGREEEKRFMCAAFGQMDFMKLIHIDQMAVLRYQGILKSGFKVLRKAVLAEKIMISGEDFLFILRYIGITQMRSSMGYVLEDVEGTEEPELLDELFGELSDAIGYSFTVSEQKILMELIQNSNMIRSEYLIKPEHSYIQEMEQFVIKKLQLKKERLFEESELLEQNIDAMLRRLSRNRHSVNYYDKDILYKYPLAIHIMSQAFRNVYGKELSRSDLLDMAVYLGGFLDNMKYPSPVRVLLVGNQNFQILDNIRRYVLRILPFIPDRFELLPGYILDKERTYQDDYDLFLTTEPDVLLKNSNYLLIPVIMTEGNIQMLTDKIEVWVKKYNKSKIQELEKKTDLQTVDHLGDLNMIIPADILNKTTVYALNKKTLLLICTEDTVQTGVTWITLKKCFIYDYKEISQIIFVRFDEKESGIIEYFQTVSRMLQKQK